MEERRIEEFKAENEGKKWSGASGKQDSCTRRALQLVRLHAHVQPDPA